MQNKKIKLTGLSIALASLLMTACGGGGGSSGGGGDPEPIKISGRAVDGPLSGATVTFLDCNNATEQTDATGNFDFPENCTESEVHIAGGIDTTTDRPFVGELKAPKMTNTSDTRITVSPITTLIQAAVAAGATPEAASAQVASLLGLGSINLLTADPMQNKDLYAKTVAVQEFIEQIQETIAAVGASTTSTDLNAKAFDALYAALANTSGASGTDALSNVNVISAAISNTLEAVKTDLPADIASNLDNVKSNLASASAANIAKNIKAVETAVQNIPAAAFSSSGSAGIDAVKTASQEAIVATKENIAAERVIEQLLSALTLPPSEVGDALKAVAEAAATGADPSTITTALETLETKAGIDPDTLGSVVSDPNSFYPDYLQLDGFVVQGTTYTTNQLNASIGTPLNVTSVKDIAIGLKAVGSYATTANPIVTSPAIRLSTGAKTLSINADKLNLSYTNGTLTSAILPTGAQITVKSNITSIGTLTFTLNSDKNVLSNGKIALNATTLSSISSSLASQLSSFNLANETVSVTAVLKGTPHFAILKSDNTPTSATKYTVEGTSGAGISAKFKPQQ